MTIGENIKKYRQELKLTQKQLGEIIGISQQQIAQYESGKRTPKIETLAKISHALNVSIGDLDLNYSYMLQDQEDAASLITQLKQFIEDISNMDITEEIKQENILKANELIKITYELIKTIDSAKESDQKRKHLLEEKRMLKNDIQKAEQDIEDMCLSVFRQLNLNGQEKAIAYTADLAKIPEYRKDTE